MGIKVVKAFLHVISARSRSDPGSYDDTLLSSHHCATSLRTARGLTQACSQPAHGIEIASASDPTARICRLGSRFLSGSPTRLFFGEIMARCLTTARKMPPFRMDIAGENLIIRLGRVDFVPLGESLSEFDETRRNANKTFFTV